jgi:type II secretory pathway component GspD/PulD (secretin)
MKSKLTRILIGSATLALLAAQAVAEGKISGITTKAVGGGLQVQIKGEELTAPKITRVMGGRSFLLEFDASLTTDPQWLRVEQGGVHYVQSVQSGPSKIRIYLRVDPNTKLDVAQNGEGFGIKISETAGAPAPAPAADLTPANPVSVKVFPERAKLTGPTATMHQHVPVATVATYAKKGRSVSLDFVNTDVVQILKALAMQANVNIVTSPDVKGSLTVSLGSVSVKEALDLITTLAGVKYTQVGNTYLVSASDKFANILQNLNGRAAETSETRVVPLYSGEGGHIKDALRSSSMDVEMILPSEQATAVASVASAQQGNPEKDAANNLATGVAQAKNSNQANDPKNPNKDTYIVLVGPSNKIDQVERMVKDVDEQMCRIVGVEFPHENVMIRTVYHPKGNSAANLLLAIAPNTDKSNPNSFHAKVGTVEIYATPVGSVSEQNVVLYGRETEVNRLMSNLESIDTLAQTSGDYKLYDVRYSDPRALREELIANFPGLVVSIPPSSVGNPAVYQQNQIEKQNQERVGDRNATASNGNNSGNQQTSTTSAAGGTTTAADTGQVPGLTAPFAIQESQAVPMKLVLHGSSDQIQGALAYLQAVDTQPKQVAIELRVMELSKEDAMNIGLNWSILTGGKVQAIQMNQNGGVSPANNGAFPNANPSSTPPGLLTTAQTQLQPLSTAGTLQGLVSGIPGVGTLGITATLDQLADSSKMIARPNVLALDGRETEMFVGDDVKYIQSIQSAQTGTTVTTGDVEVGVKLACLPRVGADDTITMDLRPMVSTLESMTPVPGGGFLPQTGLRISQSTMVMHSGDTIAIGGLIQDSDTHSTGGIPFLKDLPIIGLLFSHSQRDHTRHEIVFFLTAKVVNDQDIANAANPMNHDPMGQHAKALAHPNHKGKGK